MSAGDTPGRLVLLGLAPARSQWFDVVSLWCDSATLAAEFLKCLSVEELKLKLSSRRPFSALLVDSAFPGLDRDLVDLAGSFGIPTVLVRSSPTPGVSALELGAASEICWPMSAPALAKTLVEHAGQLRRADRLPPVLKPDPPASTWAAPFFAVCGPGGTGSSTLAMCLAQGLGADLRLAQLVLLADLALNGEQAMYHDVAPSRAGLAELVESHRLRDLSAQEVLGFSVEVPSRGYRLLAGLRQPEAWSGLRPRAVESALTSLAGAHKAVVADITGDFEGEAQCGSADVEERNLLARSAAGRASVLVVVAGPGMKGAHSMARLIKSACRAGVDPHRVLPVFNRSVRSPGSRAELSKALASLLSGYEIDLGLSGALHLPERKLEEAHQRVTALPDALVAPLTKAVSALARHLEARPITAALAPGLRPLRITPGSLGT